MNFFSENQSILLKTILNKYGYKQQLAMLQEESTELALAIHKYLNRSPLTEEKFNHLLEEIADVIIMIEQAKQMFPVDRIKWYIDFKLQRQDKRLHSK